MQSSPACDDRRQPIFNSEKPGIVSSKRFNGLNFPKKTLLNRVNDVDPLTCPKCQEKMRRIVFKANSYQ